MTIRHGPDVPHQLNRTLLYLFYILKCESEQPVNLFPQIYFVIQTWQVLLTASSCDWSDYPACLSGVERTKQEEDW